METILNKPITHLPLSWWTSFTGHTRRKEKAHQDCHVQTIICGFSLVEVLVSAAILGVVILAIVAVVRKGGDIQVSGTYLREARTILNARFETMYGQEKYALIVVQPETGIPVTLDPGNGVNPLPGTLYTTVDVPGGTPVPAKQVTLALAWDNADGERDSISMTKWISE